MRTAGLVPLLVLAAGCLSVPPPAGTPEVPPDLVDDLLRGHLDLFHDHTDPTLHVGGRNFEQVAWSTLGVELGRNGFANFVLHESGERLLAFVAIDGDADGGFVIADVSDPDAITPLGRYAARGSGFQEVRVLPGGEYALLNVQELPGPALLLPPPGPADCGTCLHVVDVRDPTDPRLASVFPVDLIGTHNMDAVVIGGETWVFYTGQPLYRGADLRNPAPGNYVGMARVVEGPGAPRLVKVGELRAEEAMLDPKRSFPHDVLVLPHPIDGRTIAYVSHWEGGAMTFDVTDPLRPLRLGTHKDPAPSDVSNIHWFAPEDRPRAGRLVAWSAPEIAQLETGTGVMRTYDVTDPARIEQLGTWALPLDDLAIHGQFLLSPHIVQPDSATGLVAVTHYHAGVWVLDGTDPANPEPLGWWMPVGDPDDPYEGPIWWKKPNFDPEGFLPNVYQARWNDGLLWVTERGTGLYALRYTGPVPGPLG